MERSCELGHEPAEYVRGTNQLLAPAVDGSLSSFQRQKPHASRKDNFYEALSVEIGPCDSQQQEGVSAEGRKRSPGAEGAEGCGS